MKKVLVSFQKNWADEFNVHGFKIFKSQEDWKEAFDKIEKSSSHYFGTNQGWWSEYGDEGVVEDDFVVLELSDEETSVIENMFGEEYGYFPGE